MNIKLRAGLTCFRLFYGVIFIELVTKPSGIKFYIDIRRLPKDSIDMFEIEDLDDVLKGVLPKTDHLDVLREKNKLSWSKTIKNFPIKIENAFINKIQLKNLYQRHFDLFNGISKNIFGAFKGSNRLYVKISCYQGSNLVEPTILENYISGFKNQIDKIYNAVPSLKNQYKFVDIDNYEKFKLFAKNAYDNKGRPRFNETEVKMLYNFINNHYHKGDRFVIEMESVLYTCKNCQKYLQSVQNVAKNQGKIIEFKFVSHPEAESLTVVEQLIK
ncbi:MAG: hypothetical protein DI529_15225 [Chryseobacterium sp.]|nr:MAG: hypothetical protein DI529_15225 [Chryseobacterium sp.]